MLALLEEVRERGAAPAVMLERDGRHRPPPSCAGSSGRSRRRRGWSPGRERPRGPARPRSSPPSSTHPDPPGFATDRLAATRAALLRKRSGQAAAAWPLLAAGLGADWTGLACTVLAGRPVAGALRDGWDVARAARDAGRLSEGARRELVERERAFRYDVRPPRPRRLRRLITQVGALFRRSTRVSSRPRGERPGAGEAVSGDRSMTDATSARVRVRWVNS
ncbi:hypothetical protein GCM10023215_63550 [Pseudonocardia yuanmonensis]|uniref:SCO6045-like C-terminal domain-containing protein n=1 Tax=Pseudonocardia yuanmonensis TaxID=1095914 RepID=A0ABP8XR86_9PSEU